jgi:hypothetical protein
MCVCVSVSLNLRYICRIVETCYCGIFFSEVGEDVAVVTNAEFQDQQ